MKSSKLDANFKEMLAIDRSTLKKIMFQKALFVSGAYQAPPEAQTSKLNRSQKARPFCEMHIKCNNIT